MPDQFQTKMPDLSEEGATQKFPVDAALAFPLAVPAGAHPELADSILAALRTVFDPEIPVNIYDLGLIYNIDVDEAGFVNVKMTLTAPNCPAAGSLPGTVQDKVAGVPGVTGSKAEVVWEPTWHKDMMSEAAKLELGFF